MLINRLSGTINGKFKDIDFGNSKSTVLVGDKDTCEYIINLLVAMLSCDYNGLYTGSRHYFDHPASLDFSTGGVLYIRNQAVEGRGSIPSIHLVELCSDDTVRSTVVSDFADTTDLDGITRNISGGDVDLPAEDCMEIARISNKIVGLDYCFYDDGEFVFDFGVSEDMSFLKTVFLMVSECFLTPNNYRRLVLLHDSFAIKPEKMGIFIEELDNIRNLERVICSGVVNGLSNGSAVMELHV